MDGFTEFEGKNIDEAIHRACTFFNAQKTQLEIEIVRDGKSGVFGIVPKRTAIIRARCLVQVPVEPAEDLALAKPIPLPDSRPLEGRRPQPRLPRRRLREPLRRVKLLPREENRKPMQADAALGQVDAEISARASLLPPPVFGEEGQANTFTPKPLLPQDAHKTQPKPLAKQASEQAHPLQTSPDAKDTLLNKAKHEKACQQAEAPQETEQDTSVQSAELLIFREDQSMVIEDDFIEEDFFGEPLKSSPPPYPPQAVQPPRWRDNVRRNVPGRARPSHVCRPRNRPNEDVPLPPADLGAEAQMPFDDLPDEFSEGLPLLSPETLHSKAFHAYVETVLQNIIAPIIGRPVGLAIEALRDKLRVHVDSGELSGLLIGRDGQTLMAIRYIATRILAHKTGAVVRLQLDVGEYREHQEAKIQEMAISLANRARQTGRPCSTRLLTSYQRRLVHLALQNIPDIQSRSMGAGTKKRVVISYAPGENRRPLGLDGPETDWFEEPRGTTTPDKPDRPDLDDFLDLDLTKVPF